MQLQNACKNLGYNGKVGDVKDSCNKYKSCFAIAAGENGSIGNVLSSCNNDSACYEAGLDGITSSLWNCCNSVAEECKNANDESLPAECKVSAGYACCDTPTSSCCRCPSLLLLIISILYILSCLHTFSILRTSKSYRHRPNPQSWHLSQERPRRQRRHRLQLRLLLPRRPKCRSRSQWRMKIYSIKVRGVFSGPVNVKNVVLRDESMILPLRYCCCVTSCDLHISGGGGGGG